MSKESPLSHHEQLRYDYLFKNIHYLNDRERREFDYLQQKMAGPKSEVHPSYQEEKEETWGRDIELPTYGSRSRSKKREKVAPQPKVKKKKKNSLQTNIDLVPAVDYMRACRDDFHVS